MSKMTAVGLAQLGGTTPERLHGKASTARTAHLICMLQQHGADRPFHAAQSQLVSASLNKQYTNMLDLRYSRK
jgi:hypothetical protein